MISEHISSLILSFLLICTDSIAVNLTAFLHVVKTTLKLWQRHIFFSIFSGFSCEKKTKPIQDINELKKKRRAQNPICFFYFCKFAKKNWASESKRTNFVINVWESQSQASLCFLALFAFSCILMFWWMCRITGLSIRLFIFL